jgi:hypothetical protein
VPDAPEPVVAAEFVLRALAPALADALAPLPLFFAVAGELAVPGAFPPGSLAAPGVAVFTSLAAPGPEFAVFELPQLQAARPRQQIDAAASRKAALCLTTILETSL